MGMTTHTVLDLSAENRQKRHTSSTVTQPSILLSTFTGGKCNKQSMVFIHITAPSGTIQNPILAQYYSNLNKKSLGTCMPTMQCKKQPCQSWVVVRGHTFQAPEVAQQGPQQ